MSDPVNKPSHYNAGEVETIDGIRAALGEGFADYCKGNVLKYVWRCGKKGDAVEDLRKAATYLQWAIEAMDGNCPVMPDSSSSKSLAIPSGWRELQVGETLSKTDMYESNGKWNPYVDSNPAGSDFPKYSKGIHYRHIRKIETAKGPEYREPTKADIVHGPIEVEACTPNPDTGERLWRKRNLVAIHKHNPRFGVEHPNNASEIVNYMEARIKIEAANPSETPNSSTAIEWIPKVGDKVRVVCATPFPKEDRFGTVVKDNVRPREDLFLVKTSNGIFSWFYTSELELIEAAK